VKVTGPARGGGKRVMAVAATAAAAVVAMVAVAAAARSYSRRRGGIGGDLNDLLSILYVCVSTMSPTHGARRVSERAGARVCVLCIRARTGSVCVCV